VLKKIQSWVKMPKKILTLGHMSKLILTKSANMGKKIPIQANMHMQN